jgi:signal transduction histidine kinase
MRRSGWFERRLLLTLVLFSFVPSLLLVGLGTIVLRDAAYLQSTPAVWESLAESGRRLLELSEASGDTALVLAAAQHREELTVSVQQAQRWAYVNRRILAILPWTGLFFLLVLSALAVRFARGIARDLTRPIRELVGWSGMVARDEPLPSNSNERDDGEFATLRDSFRGMAAEIRRARAREVETASVRSAVALARGVAHELKNALTPLTLAIRTLQRHRSGTADEASAIEVIEAESRRLEGLARAFSQFGRPPEGPHSRVDLGELLEYLVRTYLPETVKASVRVEERLPGVNGYYDPLSRAFANLLLNAAEALGPEGGAVDVEARRRGDGEVEIIVRDSGPGLPPDGGKRIWDPDFTTKAQGTGLGLALVRQTVHAHGGSVTAANSATGGAEFRVILPAAPEVGEHAGFAETSIR